MATILRKRKFPLAKRAEKSLLADYIEGRHFSLPQR